ncbi:MAG: NAD(P)H-dependent oxidoreductase subunit E [Methyloligellaceae bacterium]
MSVETVKSADAGTIRKKRKGRQKGRTVDLNELLLIQNLLGEDLHDRSLLIEHLHTLQKHFGYLTSSALVALAHAMKLAPAEVYEVATFYHHFDVVKDGESAPPALTVRVCDSISCEMSGSHALIKKLRESLGESVRVQAVPCVGRCHSAPIAIVGENPIEHANPSNVQLQVTKGSVTDTLTPDYMSAESYVESGGYSFYHQCVNREYKESDVIARLQDSSLRGLGGAGFPAGIKWEIVRGQADPKIMAVNVDEGEPGTFKDRVYLEQNPHRFFEGMLIAAWAVGIDEVYIYIRDEYPTCLKILKTELLKLQTMPVMKLPAIHFRRGAGSYICGEESAMIESIEGKRGIPRLRPPYVAEVGLFGRPTLEHNFETLYWVPEILQKGSDWFASQGRNGRKGLRSFSVSGRVKTPGVHLAPAGITLRELIYEYCGGMLDGHTLYGYFPGGASGGMLPASLADIPLDFDTLQAHGSFIGSAAVIVLSEHDSARQAATNAMRFFANESCGQCTPCRVGTSKAAEMMESDHWNLEILEDLCQVMEDASICGLGQAAPNPLRSLIRYFPQELDLQEDS